MTKIDKPAEGVSPVYQCKLNVSTGTIVHLADLLRSQLKAIGSPFRSWLSNLPDDTPPTTLVRPAKLRRRIEHDYREMKQALGLAHFEGRTWNGWHHHVTLVSAAHAFAGSIAGTALGGLLLGVFLEMVLIHAPAVILLVSAVKLARHD